MDEFAAAAEAAAKNAKRAMVLTMIGVAVAVVVLFIDQVIKKAVIEEAQNARRILADFTVTAREVRDGAEAAREAGSGDGADVGGGDAVVHDAAAGTVLDQAESTPGPAPRSRKARVA